MDVAAQVEHPDGCALDEHGNLKDAKDIVWHNSPSDDVTLALPAVQDAAAPPAQGGRPQRNRRAPLPKDAPFLVAGTSTRKRPAQSPSPTSSAPSKAARRMSVQQKRRSSPSAAGDDLTSDSRSLDGLDLGILGLELGHSSDAMSLDDVDAGLNEDTDTGGATSTDADDLGRSDSARYDAAITQRNISRRDRVRHRDDRSDDIRLAFAVATYDKDGKGARPGHWCKLCIESNNGKKKPAFFLTGSISTLRTHVARMPGHYEQYLGACTKQGVKPHPRAKPVSKEEKSTQQTLDTFTVANPTPHWTVEGLIDHIVQLLIEADLSHRIVDLRAFRQLLIYMRPKTADSQIPRRTTIRGSILQKGEKLEDIDKDIIQRVVGLISTTFDGWTSGPGLPFLSLTIHYIDAPAENPRDWVLKGQLLALEKVIGNHSGANTAALLLRLINKFDFGKKLGWLTADNVTTNDTAIADVCLSLDPSKTLMKAKERRARCVAHQIHLAAHHFVKGLPKVSNAALRKRLHGHPSRSIASDGDELDGLSEDEFVDTSMDPEDAGGGQDPGDEEFTPGDVIGKVLVFVKQVNASPQAREFLKKMCRDTDLPEPELRGWVVTRWASLYNCFDTVLSIREAVNRFCALADRAKEVPPLRKKKYADFTLSDGDWLKLKLSHRVLQEPAHAQQALSSEKIPTVSRALPILETLQTKWDEMLADPTFALVHSGLERGLANLRKWYKLTDETDIYFVCMILDPTVKLEYFNQEWDSEWIQAHRVRFEKTFKRYAERVTGPETSSAHTSQPAQKDSAPSSHYGAAAVARARQGRVQRELANYKAVSEVERYLTAPLEIADENSEFDTVRWWGHHQNEYPVLATIARDYLAIQGSAVASERVFSGTAITVTKRRNRLSATMISALQRLKYAYRDGRLSAVNEAWVHLDETFDEADYETEED